MFLYFSAMKRYRQYEPLTVSDFEVAQWHHPIHRHNHYELIYIKDGQGIHYIQQVANPYQRGDVFLLGPDDDHYFEIDISTHFVYIKFNNPYVYANSMPIGFLQQLEYLIKSRETHLRNYIIKASDQDIIANIFNIVVALKKNLLHNEQLIWMQVLVLAAILQRNMPELKPASEKGSDMQAMFCYVHKHIYTPEKLKAAVMAAHFHTTTNYIGPYFKRNAGITLREYIADYRATLINQRIASQRYSLKELAAAFGLTDESHVLKSIKKVNK